MTGDAQRLEIMRKDVDAYSYAKVQIHVGIAVGYCRELLGFYDALARQLAEAQQRCEKLLSERQEWLAAIGRKDAQIAHAERLLAQRTESASLDRLDAPAIPEGQIGHGTLPEASPYKNDPAILESLRTAQQRIVELEASLEVTLRGAPQIMAKNKELEARLADAMGKFGRAVDEAHALRERLTEVVAALEQYHQVMTVLVIHLETHNAVVEPKTSQVSEQVMTALKEARDAGEAALAKARA